MSVWPIRNSRSRFRTGSMSSLLPVPELRRRCGIAALLAVCVVAGGCAASAALRRGSDAERRQDYDFAVVEYTKALRLHADDANARLALERAKLRASDDHFNKARRLAAA